MGTTPKYAIRFPALADPADVPTDMQELALDVEGAGPMGWWASPNFTVPGLVWSRPAANGSGFLYHPATAGGYAFYATLQSDTALRFTLDVNGAMNWGAGGATAVDTNLYRSAAASLKTDGALVVGNYVYAATEIIARYGSPTQTQIGYVGGCSGIVFGSAGDTNLYRSAAGVLGTDGWLKIGANTANEGIRFYDPASNGYGAIYRNNADGSLNFQSGNHVMLRHANAGKVYFIDQTNAPAAYDTTLYRLAANTLGSDGDIEVRTASAYRVRLGYIAGPAAGGLQFGTTYDTNLYRSTAGILRTDGAFYAGGDVIAQYGAAEVVYIGKRGPAAQAGIVFGSDASMYRYGANSIRTNSSFIADGYIQTQAQFFYSGHGSGGISVIDVQMYRGGANTWFNFFNGAWGTFSAAAFSVQSDRKTKSDVEQAEPLHERLLGAGVYRYRRDDTEEKHLGLMADELPEDVVANGTDPSGTGEMQFVDVYKLCAALVQTVQHLNERLTTLEGSAA